MDVNTNRWKYCVFILTSQVRGFWSLKYKSPTYLLTLGDKNTVPSLKIVKSVVSGAWCLFADTLLQSEVTPFYFSIKLNVFAGKRIRYIFIYVYQIVDFQSLDFVIVQRQYCVCMKRIITPVKTSLRDSIAALYIFNQCWFTQALISVHFFAIGIVIMDFIEQTSRTP